MPFRQQAEVVLQSWREAERRLAVATPGSAAERAAASDLGRMRDEYQLLIRLAREQQLPEPPPFPESLSD